MATDKALVTHKTALVIVLILSGCSGHQDEKRSDQKTVARQVMTLLPGYVKNKPVWAKDIAGAFHDQKINPVVQNLCAVIAVAGQESGFLMQMHR